MYVFCTHVFSIGVQVFLQTKVNAIKQLEHQSVADQIHENRGEQVSLQQHHHTPTSVHGNQDSPANQSKVGNDGKSRKWRDLKKLSGRRKILQLDDQIDTSLIEVLDDGCQDNPGLS